MARMLIPCALAVLLAGLVPMSAAPVPESTETVIRLQVAPMAAPRPALKYQLLPEVHELQPGQVVHNFLKSFMEQNYFFFNKEAEEKREQYLTMPLADLPLKEIRASYGTNSGLRQADYAARLETVDWQMLPILRREGINALLPEVQQLRRLAAALKVRFRLEVAEKRFDDAVRTAKTMLALSRALGEHPTLIAALVGVAIANMAIGPIEEMIEQPGSPNLYWALTSLPDPLVELRKVMQGERLLMGKLLESFEDPSPQSAEQLDRLIQELDRTFKNQVDKFDAAKYVKKKVADSGQLKAARQRLIDAGCDAKQVNAYLSEQVILADEYLTFLAERDELAKAILLPHYQMQTVLAGHREKASEEGLFLGLIPAIRKVKLIHSRLAQRLALLRVVESLRLHAAERGGFPSKLDEVRVPLPDDPVTGKPFQYRLEGGKAILQGTPAHGEEKNPVWNVRYELTLRK